MLLCAESFDVEVEVDVESRGLGRLVIGIVARVKWCVNTYPPVMVEGVVASVGSASRHRTTDTQP